MLGASLTNFRWSWGAVRPKDGAVFLRVWRDRMRTYDGCQFVQVTHHSAVLRLIDLGYRERLKHIELIRGGAPCYLVVCEAVNPEVRPRQVRRFNHTEVFPGGRLLRLDDNWWVEMRPGVPVEKVILQSTGGLA